MSIIHPAAFFSLLQLSEWPNPGLNAIISFLDAMVGAELEVTLVRPFPLEILDVSFPSEYVTYLGSLTTPPCSEVVTWIVSSRPLTLSHEQVRRNIYCSSSGSCVFYCWVCSHIASVPNTTDNLIYTSVVNICTVSFIVQCLGITSKRCFDSQNRLFFPKPSRNSLSLMEPKDLSCLQEPATSPSPESQFLQANSSTIH